MNKDLGWDPAIINLNGGAIAIGRPIGASGVRVLTTLLKRNGAPQRQQGPRHPLHRRWHGDSDGGRAATAAARSIGRVGPVAGARENENEGLLEETWQESQW